MSDRAVTIVHYGVGNIGSIVNMLKKLGADPTIAETPEQITSARRLLLPGVGSFDAGMSHLHERGLVDALNKKALDERIPTLGICLGMQLLMEGSQEGTLAGLGWIEGEARKLPVDAEGTQLPLPHMGWNTVDIIRADRLYAGMEGELRFYFLHSYGVSCRRHEDVLSETTYGAAFVSALQRENIFGTQFHPEKSHRFGMQLLANFVRAT